MPPNKPAPWSPNLSKVDPAWLWVWRDLIAWWPMWEGSGTLVRDHGGNALDGTMIGVTPPDWNPTAQNETDSLGQSVHLGTGAVAENARIEIPDDPLLELDARPYSVWVRCYPVTTGEAGNGRIIDKGGARTGSSGWSLVMVATATFEWWVNDNSANLNVANDNSLTLNQWNDIGVVIDSAGDAAIYVDGSLVGQKTDNVAPEVVANTRVVAIGTESADFDRQFDGSVSDVRMWDRELSAWEMSQLSVDRWAAIRALRVGSGRPRR